MFMNECGTFENIVFLLILGKTLNWILNSDFRNKFSTKAENKVESRHMILSTQNSAVDSALELETILCGE